MVWLDQRVDLGLVSLRDNVLAIWLSVAQIVLDLCFLIRTLHLCRSAESMLFDNSVKAASPRLTDAEHSMKVKFSLLSLICIVAMVAMAAALFDANRRVENANRSIAKVTAESESLKTRLGEQAEESEGQVSICYFNDTYSSRDELRWRIKVPANANLHLMYARSIAPESKFPVDGRELALTDTNEFVLVVEFSDSSLRMRTYPELPEGSRSGPMRATEISCDGWLASLASAKRQIAGYGTGPQYFAIGKPFKILELPDETNPQLTIWLE